MNNPQHKSSSLLALIILAGVCNTAAAVESSVQTNNAAPINTECLLNWAQTFYPDLFSPMVPKLELQFFAPYTYRYYPNTNAYVGVSSADNHVYYWGPNDASPQDVGDSSGWLTAAGCQEKLYPVIFIHGIASSADAWTAYRDYLINNNYGTFGGIPAYNPSTKTVNIGCPIGSNLQCTGRAGDFYTLNFSDNQGLPFDVQGGELAAVIQAVLDANPGKTKVLLVSHSMGGLAAREYLQGLARESNAVTTLPYRGDVAKLITVGTPHQGTFWAEQCRNQFDIFGISGDLGICKLLSLQIDRKSIAVEALQPNSPALNILNDLANHPLPSDISYVSIIGAGQPTLFEWVGFKEGDGIVSDISQDLMTVTGNLSLQQKTVKIDILFRECGNKMYVPIVGDVGQTHTCEATDLGVLAEILSDL